MKEEVAFEIHRTNVMYLGNPSPTCYYNYTSYLIKRKNYQIATCLRPAYLFVAYLLIDYVVNR